MVIFAERMIAEAREQRRDLETPADFTMVDAKTLARLSRGEIIPPSPPLHNVAANNIAPSHIIADIGVATRWSWSDHFGPARTIFWHGPLGICEIERFCEGTRFLATELANRTWPGTHRRVVCGTSLVASLRRIGFPLHTIKHITHAGRASLHYFAGRPLPAVDVLDQAGDRDFRNLARVLIPVNGSDRDADAAHAAAEIVARKTEIVLLHVFAGPDQEQYPDVVEMLSAAEKLERRMISDRAFARANAILAERGLVAARQLVVQWRPTTMILRYARRLEADPIVLVAAGAFATFGARRGGEPGELRNVGGAAPRRDVGAEL
jgi:hypothetical protein